jgi:hypothetical protein
MVIGFGLWSWDIFLVRYRWRKVRSLGYLLVLVLLLELFSLSKVKVLGGGCMPMVG